MTERARTLRAAIVAMVVTFAAVAGIAVFLGFPGPGSVIAGVVSGVLAGALLLGASRRAASFHPPPDMSPAADMSPTAGPTGPADEQSSIAHDDTATDDTGSSR